MHNIKTRFNYSCTNETKNVVYKTVLNLFSQNVLTNLVSNVRGTFKYMQEVKQDPTM